VSVMGEPVEQSVSKTFGSEHLGPFVNGRDLKCCVDQEVVQRVRLSSPALLGPLPSFGSGCEPVKVTTQ
jgi:hypothetical protein